MFILNLICLFVVDFVRFLIFGSLEWYKGLEIENGRGSGYEIYKLYLFILLVLKYCVFIICSYFIFDIINCILILNKDMLVLDCDIFLKGIWFLIIKYNFMF